MHCLTQLVLLFFSFLLSGSTSSLLVSSGTKLGNTGYAIVCNENGYFCLFSIQNRRFWMSNRNFYIRKKQVGNHIIFCSYYSAGILRISQKQKNKTGTESWQSVNLKSCPDYLKECQHKYLQFCRSDSREWVRFSVSCHLDVFSSKIWVLVCGFVWVLMNSLLISCMD